MSLSFNELDLYELSPLDLMAVPPVQSDPAILTREIKVNIAERTYALLVEKKTPYKCKAGGERHTIWEYSLADGDARKNLTSKLSLFECGTNVMATEAIERVQKDGPLPKGFGVQFWIKMLEVIPRLSSVIGRPVEHSVLIQTGLRFDRWLEIFGPTLNERGYTRARWSDLFKKTYIP